MANFRPLHMSALVPPHSGTVLVFAVCNSSFELDVNAADTDSGGHGINSDF